MGEQGKVVGLDFSENMLSVGKQKVEALQLKQVELLHGNAMELPFEDNTFDYVTIGFGLRNVPDYMHVLKEMTRVVKPWKSNLFRNISTNNDWFSTRLYFIL